MIPSYSSSLEQSSLNHESLIFGCSHLLFSYYEPSFFLCALFPQFVEGNQLPSGTHSSNEWIPWSWGVIQGGYNNILFFLYFFIVASNTSFWFLQGWHMRDEMIFNRIWNDYLGSILSLISLCLLDLSYWNTYLYLFHG